MGTAIALLTTQNTLGPHKGIEASTMTINDSSIPKDKSPIFLVHGTWGRGILRLDPPTDLSRGSMGRRRKRWFEEGSEFHLHLDEELKKVSLDGTVRAFLWSGANSVTA